MTNESKDREKMGGFRTSLLPHQQQAFDKLKGLKIGALYMDMGTGKTRTMLEIIKLKYDAGKFDVVIWLCPCSVIQNLKDDIRYHYGSVPDFFVIKGIESIGGSAKLYLKLLKAVQQHRCLLVVDESNLVKNWMAKRTQRIIDISKYCNYKYILNGTPVSRNEADMFAQWYILDKRVLGYNSYWSFAANHLVYREVKDARGNKRKTDQVVHVLNVGYLTEKIAPYSFQIKKEECIKLPTKHYRTYYFDIGNYEHYLSIFERYREEVDDMKSETIYKLFTACQLVTSGRRVLTGPKERMKSEDFYESPLDNPRIQKLEYIIDSRIEDEQVIIFAKYQKEIEEIKILLYQNGISYTEFTGNINRKQRINNLEEFRSGKAQVLLSNKMCGAYGLNLQFCRNIIFYSNDFDYATRQQAEDRVHRLGQTQDVYIYDLVATGTIDEFITENLQKKDGMVYSFQKWIKKLQEKKELTADAEHKESTESAQKKGQNFYNISITPECADKKTISSIISITDEK